MNKQYKIIHPAHIGDWAAVHSQGKVVRRADARDVDAPIMGDADARAGCVVVVVDDWSMNSRPFARVAN